MHELSIADAIVQICCDNAAGGTVAKVEVKIGRLRQVVPDALRFAFELVSEGTPVDGAELEIIAVPARVACRACAAETETGSFPLACARCRSVDVEVVAGEELYVESLEIERPSVAMARR
ncbi:MAG: hydrogenase maturation nickel metallochaperone HypA [Gaiellaceae bacterium]